jgi:hypothetical protein
MPKSDEQSAVEALLKVENPDLLSTESMDVLQEAFNAGQDDSDDYDPDDTGIIDLTE